VTLIANGLDAASWGYRATGLQGYEAHGDQGFRNGLQFAPSKRSVVDDNYLGRSG